MARPTERLQVGGSEPIAALLDGYDVVYHRGSAADTSLQALLTEGLPDVLLFPRLSPFFGLIKTLCEIVSPILVVLAVCESLMILAVSAVHKFWTAGIGAGSLWFFRHIYFLPAFTYYYTGVLFRFVIVSLLDCYQVFRLLDVRQTTCE